MYILRHSFGRLPTSLISCYAFELGVKWFVDWCSCMHYTTWRGSLSVSDRIILILFSKWAPSISRRSERKPRSVLLCSQRMTFIPWEAASRTSWWDISPTNKGKSKYLSTKHRVYGMLTHNHTKTTFTFCMKQVQCSRTLYIHLASGVQVSYMSSILKRDRSSHWKFQILGRFKTSIQTCISNSI